MAPPQSGQTRGQASGDSQDKLEARPTGSEVLAELNGKSGISLNVSCLGMPSIIS